MPPKGSKGEPNPPAEESGNADPSSRVQALESGLEALRIDVAEAITDLGARLDESHEAAQKTAQKSALDLSVFQASTTASMSELRASTTALQITTKAMMDRLDRFLALQPAPAVTTAPGGPRPPQAGRLQPPEAPPATGTPPASEETAVVPGPAVLATPAPLPPVPNPAPPPPPVEDALDSSSIDAGSLKRAQTSTHSPAAAGREGPAGPYLTNHPHPTVREMAGSAQGSLGPSSGREGPPVPAWPPPTPPPPPPLPPGPRLAASVAATSGGTPLPPGFRAPEQRLLSDIHKLSEGQLGVSPKSVACTAYSTAQPEDLAAALGHRLQAAEALLSGGTDHLILKQIPPIFTATTHMLLLSPAIDPESPAWSIFAAALARARDEAARTAASSLLLLQVGEPPMGTSALCCIYSDRPYPKALQCPAPLVTLMLTDLQHERDE